MRKRSNTIGMGVAIAIAIVLLLVGLAGGYFIGSSSSKSSSSNVSITEAGSTLLQPLMQIWGPNYTAKANSHVTLSPNGGGSGAGQSESEAGTIDIGASDAYTANNLGVVDVPVAFSAQLVMYNLPGLNNMHLNLNGTILAKIYMAQITKWNDPLIAAANPGVTLPSQSIIPVVRADSSGDTYIFSTYCDMSYAPWIYGNNTKAFQTIAPADGFQSGTANSGVITKLNATQYSIGYVGISYESIALATGNLGYAALGDNQANSASGGTTAANYILPTAANISDDANLGLQYLNYNAYGLALSLILGGSPAGAITWATGGGGTNPTAQYPTPYPIVNMEYTLVKTAPSSPSHQTYVVQFLMWAISYGNAEAYLSGVNFVALTPQVVGLDMQALATVQISA